MLKQTFAALVIQMLTLSSYATVICNNGEIKIVRGQTYSWGGQESYLTTSSPEIQSYLGQISKVRGYLLQTRFNKIEGEFEYIPNDWAHQIQGYSITLKQHDSTRKVELKLRRSPMIGCVEYRTISGCYAGDECIQECVRHINLPEDVLYEAEISCTDEMN